MFGYVVPDKPNMFMKDYYLYKAFYCGICKTIGHSTHSQLMRLTTNYDITFLNVLYHSLFDKDIELNDEVCILNPVKKKSIVKDDELTKDIIDVNTILMHYKCVDDIIDDKSSSKALVDKVVLRKSYRKAKEKFPNIDKAFEDGYNRLREYEKKNEGSIDKVSDAFAKMMYAVGKELFKEKFNVHLGNLMYSIGKWIYIIDAIDDIDKDYKEKKYNMFLQGYEYKDKETFLKDKKEELSFALEGCYQTMLDSFDNIKVEKYEGILTNILWYGIKKSIKEILEGRREECKKIRI